MVPIYIVFTIYISLIFISAVNYDLRIDVHPASKDLVRSPPGTLPRLKRWNFALTKFSDEYGGMHPIGFSRHHIIPHSQLKRFWDKSIAGNRLAQLMPMITKLTRNRDLDLPAVTQAIMGNLAAGADGHANGAAPPGDNVARIMQAFCWMPCNLFVGPNGNRRVDDPQDVFEFSALSIVGPKQFGLLLNAYDLIRDINTAAAPLTAAQVTHVITLLTNDICTGQQPRYYRFERRKWTIVPQIMYKIGELEGYEEGGCENNKFVAIN
eukprot:347494_1